MVLPLYKTIQLSLVKKISELDGDPNLSLLQKALQAGLTKLMLHFGKAFKSHYILLGAGALVLTEICQMLW